jgi:valyl-tRNA synthetase
VRGVAEIVMPLAGLIDVAAEKARIGKDIAKADKEIATLEKKLANPQFIERAPEEVVAEQRARLADEHAPQAPARGRPGAARVSGAAPRGYSISKQP